MGWLVNVTSILHNMQQRLARREHIDMATDPKSVLHSAYCQRPGAKCMQAENTDQPGPGALGPASLMAALVGNYTQLPLLIDTFRHT